jgi:hypothetical protein
MNGDDLKKLAGTRTPVAVTWDMHGMDPREMAVHKAVITAAGQQVYMSTGRVVKNGVRVRYLEPEEVSGPRPGIYPTVHSDNSDGLVDMKAEERVVRARDVLMTWEQYEEACRERERWELLREPCIRRIYHGGAETLSYSDWTARLKDNELAARIAQELADGGGRCAYDGGGGDPRLFEEFELAAREALIAQLAAARENSAGVR